MTTNEYEVQVMVSAMRTYIVKAETLAEAYKKATNDELSVVVDESSLYYEKPEMWDVRASKYAMTPVGAFCFVQFEGEDFPSTEYVSFGFFPNITDEDKFGVPTDSVWTFMDGEHELLRYTDEVLYREGVHSFYVISYKLRYLEGI